MSSTLKEAAKLTETDLGDKVSTLLGDIKAIKDEMLDLEKRISVAEKGEGIRLQGLLRTKSDELNDLSDSVVMISRDAWTKFNELVQLCESEGDNPALLEPVRILCKRIEVIAADLLCFSLGH